MYPLATPTALPLTSTPSPQNCFMTHDLPKPASGTYRVSFRSREPPLGRTATIFFSIVDSPQYALGRSLVDTIITISDANYKIQRWIPSKPNPERINPPTGGYLYYKERTGDPSSHKFSNPIPTLHSVSDTAPAPPTTTSPSLQHLRAAMAAFQSIKQGPSGPRRPTNS